MKTLLAVTLALLPLSAAWAAPRGSTASNANAPRQCFLVSAISGYRTVGDEQVILRVGPNEHWRLVLQGSCPDLNWSRGRILLRQHFGGSRICTGLAAEVITSDPNFPRRCPINRIEKLTPAEVEGIPWIGRR